MTEIEQDRPKQFADDRTTLEKLNDYWGVISGEAHFMKKASPVVVHTICGLRWFYRRDKPPKYWDGQPRCKKCQRIRYGEVVD